MKAKRVDCLHCVHFQLVIQVKRKTIIKNKCELGKRVAMKALAAYKNEFLFPRYCNDFVKHKNAQ